MKYTYLTILFLILVTISHAQDIHFSQYFNSPLMINPALAGEFKGKARVIINYKNQWSSITSNPYKTFDFFADGSFFRNKLSAGLFFYQDKAGDGNMGITQISVPIAAKVKVNLKDNLKLGVLGSWSQHSLDMAKFTWNSQFDGNTINPNVSSGESSAKENFSYFDISSGFLWNHRLENKNEYNIGFSAFHINRPKYSFISSNYKLNIRWCGHADIALNVKTDFVTLYPSVLVMVQGATKEIDFGAMAKFKFGLDSKYRNANISSYVFLGAYYRNRDAIIIYTALNYRKQANIGISYDVNISKLAATSYARGGLEISLIYILPERVKNKLK